MNKRLISLLLCLMMIVLCLAGCSEKSDEDAAADISDEASDSAMTLAMYLLCEEEVSAEQAARIETAVNKITKPKFKTQLKLYFYTEDKYYEALEASFAARAKAEKEGTVSDTPATGGEDETIINEDWGITEIKYPTIDSFQVDIFYVGGFDKFEEYKNNNNLAKLDDEISHDSKLINDYISPNYLSFMKKFNNGTYAVPNNAPIGKYQYLLLNKEVLADTRYNTDAGIAQFDSFTCDAVLSVIDQIDMSKYKLYSSVGPDGLPLVDWKYWGVDERGVLCDDFSLLACVYPDAEYMEKDASYLAGTMNILRNETFKNAVKTLKMYKHNNYYGTEADLEDGKVAVAYLEGTMNIPEQYKDDYVVVPIGTPIMETEDLYENMFAVASYSTSVNRSMEIITYLNTNEEFRNLLVYGIEGENYELVNSKYYDKNGDVIKVVRMKDNNGYVMDSAKLGNSLIGYTLEGNDPTLNDYYKLQNANAKISVTMGFMLKAGDMHEVNPKWLQGVRELSAEYLKKINDAEYSDNADNGILSETFWAKLADEVEANEDFSGLKTLDADADNKYYIGLLQMYENWGVSMGIYDPEASE